MRLRVRRYYRVLSKMDMHINELWWICAKLIINGPDRWLEVITSWRSSSLDPQQEPDTSSLLHNSMWICEYERIQNTGVGHFVFFLPIEIYATVIVTGVFYVRRLLIKAQLIKCDHCFLHAPQFSNNDASWHGGEIGALKKMGSTKGSTLDRMTPNLANGRG